MWQGIDKRRSLDKMLYNPSNVGNAAITLPGCIHYCGTQNPTPPESIPMKHIVGNRSLLIVGIAESLSDLGTWITVLACFALIVFHNEGGAAESGGILLALLVPALPVSPLAG